MNDDMVHAIACVMLSFVPDLELGGWVRARAQARVRARMRMRVRQCNPRRFAWVASSLLRAQ